MANSIAKSRVEAASVEVVCTQMAVLLAKVRTLLDHNSDQAIDWAAQSPPDYIDEDTDGNINGLAFSRQAVANAIGSLDQFRRLMENESVTQGDHLGNINQLARAMPLR